MEQQTPKDAPSNEPQSANAGASRTAFSAVTPHTGGIAQPSGGSWFVQQPTPRPGGPMMMMTPSYLVAPNMMMMGPGHSFRPSAPGSQHMFMENSSGPLMPTPLSNVPQPSASSSSATSGSGSGSGAPHASSGASTPSSSSSSSASTTSSTAASTSSSTSPHTPKSSTPASSSTPSHSTTHSITLAPTISTTSSNPSATVVHLPPIPMVGNPPALLPTPPSVASGSSGAQPIFTYIHPAVCTATICPPQAGVAETACPARVLTGRQVRKQARELQQRARIRELLSQLCSAIGLPGPVSTERVLALAVRTLREQGEYITMLQNRLSGNTSIDEKTKNGISQSTFMRAPFPIIISLANGVVIQANHACCKGLGCSLEEMRRTSLVSLFDESTLEAFHHELSTRLQRDELISAAADHLSLPDRRDTWQAAGRIVAKGGKTFDMVGLHSLLRRGGNGEPYAVLSLGMCITAPKTSS